MDDTLRADGIRIAIEAEVLNFLFGMVFAEVAKCAIGLVDCGLGWVLLL